MNRQLLEKPFTREQIKQRAGHSRQSLDYVEGHTVIKRLNDALDGQWSFEIVSQDIMEQEVLVLGKLSAEGFVKSQFGASSITRIKESGEIISLADDLKAAATDALKKCATLFGVGLHLYGNGHEQKNNTNHSRTNSSYNGSGNGNGRTNNNGRLSQKQLSYLLSLADERGVSRKELDSMSRERYGCVTGFLSKADASSFIGEMAAH